MPKMKEIQKVVQKLSREEESAGGGGVSTGTKTLSPPVYRGDLISSEKKSDIDC